MTPFIIRQPAQNPGPIVFDSPHSGTHLPEHFKYACDREKLMHLHDPHVDQLLRFIPECGASVLEAQIHRSCIDLNRFLHEYDPQPIPGTPDKRSELFPSMAGPRVQRVFEIYNRSSGILPQEAEYRIDAYYKPYYAALNGLIESAQAVAGQSLHVNVHSFMRDGKPIDGIILGDANGISCDPAITRFMADFFQDRGFTVGFNGAYFSGGALILTTMDAPKGRHSIQIEIARDLYMDEQTLHYQPEKGARMAETMASLATALRKIL